MCFAGKVWVVGLIVAFDGFDELLVLVMRFVMFVALLLWLVAMGCFSGLFFVVCRHSYACTFLLL